MASPSSSRVLSKRNHDATIMPPPPPPKRIKRPAKVLDEDVYTDALSHIIARDFFPGLLESESKQEYLDALDSGDQQWIASAGRNLNEVMTPGPRGRRLRGRRGTSLTSSTSTLNGRGEETPRAGDWQGETPGSVMSSSTAATTQTQSEVEKPETNMSLSAFQKKYTSEDNESFYRLVDKQNQKKGERYAWMWAGNKIPAARQIAHRRRVQLIANKAAGEATENGGKQLATVEPADKRQAMPDTWKSKPDNNLMFAPTSVEDEMQTVSQRRQEESLAAPKMVIYDNTRVAPARDTAAEDEEGDTASAIRDAIAGKPRHPSESSYNCASTPQVNGFAFVDDRDLSPPPATVRKPGSLLLGGGDSTPNPFKLHESSKREALHHRMVEKVNKGKRAATPKRMREVAQTPKFLSSPIMGSRGNLTPAGHILRGKLESKVKMPAGLWEGKRTPKGLGKGTSI